jgi:mRNA interferase HicA
LKPDSKLKAGQFCPKLRSSTVKGSEFLQRVHTLAQRNDISYSWHPDKGKGSHGVLKYGERRTVVRNPKDELKTGTLHAMLKQLGLKHNDIA